MFIPRTARSHAEVDLAEPANAQSHANIELLALIEPQLNLFQTDNVVQVTEAIDEHGQSIAARPLRGQPNIRIESQGLHWPIYAAIDPKPNRHLLARLHGVVRVQVLAKTERLEVADIMSASEQRTVAKLRIGIGPAKTTPQRYEVPVEIFRDSMPDTAWERVKHYASMRRRCALLDARGEAMPSEQLVEKTDQYSMKSLAVIWRSPGSSDNPPATLRWDIPSIVTEMRLPIDLREIPLP